jgi:hypothetical protein
MTVSSYGVRFGIRTNEPAILDRVVRLLPPDWKAAESPVADLLYSLVVGKSKPGARIRSYHLLYENVAQVSRTLDLDEVLETLEGNIRLSVAQLAPRRVFVHAGVVAWRQKAIVLPGRTMAGKSTLVDALVRAGATYMSDECAVFDRQGRVYAFPQPLKLRVPAQGATARELREMAGRSAHSRPLPLGLVVVTHHRDGNPVWRPRRMSEGRALLAMLECAPAVRLRPEMVVDTLSRAIAGTRAVQGNRGEADEAARAILELAQW